jgi:acetylcholinesterase
VDETDSVTGLYANVFRPSDVTERSKLPVVVVSPCIIQNSPVTSSTGDSQWFYGGAFSFGDGSAFNGSTFVQRSVELGEPVIYVNFNYRVNAFGWLGGKEALAGGASNVGLHDREYSMISELSRVTASDPQFGDLPERFFLTWVRTYISKFGGDPNKVTL